MDYYLMSTILTTVSFQNTVSCLMLWHIIDPIYADFSDGT